MRNIMLNCYTPGGQNTLNKILAANPMDGNPYLPNSKIILFTPSLIRSIPLYFTKLFAKSPSIVVICKLLRLQVLRQGSLLIRRIYALSCNSLLLFPVKIAILPSINLYFANFEFNFKNPLQ